MGRKESNQTKTNSEAQMRIFPEETDQVILNCRAFGPYFNQKYVLVTSTC